MSVSLALVALLFCGCVTTTPKPFFAVQDEEVRVGTPAVVMDGSVLLFKDNQENRVVMAKRSESGGKTWPAKRLVCKGPGNHTWLAAGRKGTPSEGMIKHMAVWLVGLLMVAFWPAAGAAAGEDLNVLGKGAGKLLHAYLMRQVRGQYEQRRQAVEAALRSPKALSARQKWLAREYRRILGQMPEKTPLNAKVTGVIRCDGYRIEKVIYESRPHHHVTANLYVPTTGKGPFPGVAVACGHEAAAKTCQAYQSVCILLARNGFVALIYDPICQGERHQVLEGHHGTTTHTQLDVGSLLVGRTVVGYEAWDGIRSIDYLLSRAEVDRSKPIGMTGHSGGGAQTTFLMALDDRIGPAAPSCYLMRQQRKYETIGPPDGCQHLPGEGALGIDQIDYLVMRAPKPTLILAAEQDFFEFESTKDAAAEAKQTYTVLAKADHTGLFSHNDKHSFSKPRRQAAVQWMRRWLLDDARPVVEPKLTVQPNQALHVTKSGQVVTEFKDELTVPAINLKRAEQLASARRKFWKAGDPMACLAEIRRLIGLRERRAKAAVQSKGTIKRDGYRIEKLVLQRKGEVAVPALLFVPAGAGGRRPATLYVDSRGKAREAGAGGAIEELVRSGRIVLSIDVRGFGETADRSSNRKYRDVEHNVARLAIHIGRPLLGQRAEDVLAAADVLARRDDVDARKIDLVGIGRAGPVALHAAALDGRFTGLTMRGAIRSWVSDVVAKPLARDIIGCVVPGALLKYDMPDLLRAVTP